MASPPSLNPPPPGRRFLSTVELGNPQGCKTLVLLAGFPDDEVSGWGEVLRSLDDGGKFKDWRLLCMCLPDLENNPKTPVKPWGYGILETVEMMHATIEHHLSLPDTKITLMIHDWGSLVGMLYANRHPSRVEKAVVLDVACKISPGKSRVFLGATPYFILMLYQVWWALAYAVSQSVSLWFGELIFALYSVLVPSMLRPTPMLRQDIPRPAAEITVLHCYPYYQFWRAMLMGQRDSLTPKKLLCPVLFMYGKNKNIMFHSPGFLKGLDARCDGSKHVALEGGHWLTYGSPAQVVIREIEAFLL